MAHACKYGTNCVPYSFPTERFSDALNMGQFRIIRNGLHWQPYPPYTLRKNGHL